MTKTRVAVLRGGPSSEYDVSLQTGAGVLATLKDLDFFTKDIIISRKGEWLNNGLVKSPYQLLADIDIVFVALHGTYGEGGTVQRELERLHIPYTGSGSLSSSVAMSKASTKKALKQIDFKLPKHMCLTRDGVSDVRRTAQSISALFGPQYIIKPENGGSSIDTVLVQNAAELGPAIEKALACNNSVLVEERIVGKEATVGILENFRGEDYYALPAVEFVLPIDVDILSAGVKNSSQVTSVCPGVFSKNEKEQLSRYARLAHKAVNALQYSRSDFIVSDDGIYFLEINTSPQIGTHTPLDVALKSIGSTSGELVKQLLETAVSNK